MRFGGGDQLGPTQLTNSRDGHKALQIYASQRLDRFDPILAQSLFQRLANTTQFHHRGHVFSFVHTNCRSAGPIKGWVFLKH